MWTLASIFLTFCLKLERLSRASRESTRNLQRALGAEGRIDDLNFEIRSLKSNK